jgi:hypothetical protein
MRYVVRQIMDGQLTQTQRTRSRRLRQSNARRVGQVEYDFPAMVQALLFAGLLDPRDADDVDAVDAAIGKLLEIVCA